MTDSGRSVTMSEPGRASSSRRLIKSHCGLAPGRVRWSAKPPCSFSPCRTKTAWPRSSASGQATVHLLVGAAVPHDHAAVTERALEVVSPGRGPRPLWPGAPRNAMSVCTTSGAPSAWISPVGRTQPITASSRALPATASTLGHLRSSTGLFHASGASSGRLKRSWNAPHDTIICRRRTPRRAP